MLINSQQKARYHRQKKPFCNNGFLCGNVGTGDMLFYCRVTNCVHLLKLPATKMCLRLGQIGTRSCSNQRRAETGHCFRPGTETGVSICLPLSYMHVIRSTSLQ